MPLAIRRAWARRIRQVSEGNPLVCPRCGGLRKVIAVNEPACADTADRRPAMFRQILAPRARVIPLDTPVRGW